MRNIRRDTLVEPSDSEEDDLLSNDDEDDTRSCGGNVAYAWQNSPSDFKRTFLSSVQIATWCAIMAAIGIWVWSRTTLANAGFSFATIGSNVLYILTPTIGGTIQSALGGLVGSFWASALYIVLTWFYPGGNECDFHALRNNSTAASVICSSRDYSAVTCAAILTAVYVLAILVLNVNGSVRFFALGNYCFYFMTFMNPHDHSSSKGAFDFKGPATNGFCLYVISAVVAVFMMSVPWCYTSATRRCKTQLQMTVDGVFDLKQRVLEYTSGRTKSLEISELQSQLRHLHTYTEDCKALSTASWFEGFGCRKSWYQTNDAVKLVDQIVDRFTPLVAVVKSERFKPRHIQIMDKVHDPLGAAIQQVKELNVITCNALSNGTESDEKVKQDIEVGRDEIKRRIHDASEAARQATTGDNLVAPETESEHFLVYTTCATGHLTEKTLAELYDDDKAPPSWYQAPLNSVKSVFQIDRSHLGWACRTFASLSIALLLGYFGLGDCDQPDSPPDCANLSDRYDGNIAYTVVVFMESGGSTFASALSRISAVVLSTIVGQTLYFFFGWCYLQDKILTVVSSFFIVKVGVYIGFGGGENSAIGTRLAATALSMLWIPCSNKVSTFKTYSGYFHSLIDVVFGVALLTVVDMLFGDKPASAQAVANMEKAMDDYMKLLEDFLLSDMTMAECMETAASIKSDIIAAEGLGEKASHEPAWYRQPWQTGLFNAIADSYILFLSDLSNLASQVRHRKEDAMQRFDHFDGVAKRILHRARRTTDASKHALSGKSKEGRQSAKFLTDPLLHDPSDDALLNSLRADMNMKMQTDGVAAFEPTKQGDCTATRQCVVAVTLKSMMQSQYIAQDQIIVAQKF